MSAEHGYRISDLNCRRFFKLVHPGGGDGRFLGSTTPPQTLISLIREFQ